MNSNEVRGALASALHYLEKLLRIAYSFMLEKFEQAQTEGKAEEERLQKQANLEWHKAVESENEKTVRDIVANAIRTSGINSELNDLHSSVLKALLLDLVGTYQYWEISIPVKDSVNSIFQNFAECSKMAETVTRVMKNERTDIMQAFREKQAELCNSDQSAFVKNASWQDFYRVHYNKLKRWCITSVNVVENNMVVNVCVSETPEIQSFSPQLVYWIEQQKPQDPQAR